MKVNKYKLMRDKQQQEFNEFPMFFAFSDDQFESGMEKLGLVPADTDKLYSIGLGGFIRKADSKEFNSMLLNHDKEFLKAIESDTSGEGFIYDMFIYELANHEYGYTGDITDTLEAIDISKEKIKNNENLSNGLKKALQQYSNSN